MAERAGAGGPAVLGEVEHLVAEAASGEEIAADQPDTRVEDLVGAVPQHVADPLDGVVAHARRNRRR